MSFLSVIALAAATLEAQDASNIKTPSQADMLVGTRVPRELEWRTPTNEERWRVLWRGLALSPGAYIRSGLTASIHHLENAPRDYGQGWTAYGKRNLNSFVTYSLQDIASEGLAAAAGYEMRYIQCKCTSAMPRLGHALLFNLVTYDREGKKVLKWPKILGSYAVGVLSTQYTPNQKWSAQGLQMGTNSMIFGFVSSVLQEFTPSNLFFWRKKKSQNLPVPPAPTKPALTEPQPTEPAPIAHQPTSSPNPSIQ